MAGWDTTMPAGVTDGDLVDEGDLDPVYNNVNYLRFASVLIGGIERTSTDTATSGTAEKVCMTTPALPLDANTTYELEFGLKWACPATANDFFVKARQDNLTGGVLISFATPMVDVANAGYWMSFKVFFKTTGAVAGKVFVCTLARADGASTIAAQIGSFITVRRIGTNTVLSTV